MTRRLYKRVLWTLLRKDLKGSRRTGRVFGKGRAGGRENETQEAEHGIQARSFRGRKVGFQ